MSKNIANDKRSFSPEGFLLADAVLAKAGPLPYLREELNLPGKPGELFYLNKTKETLEKALPSFVGAPITMEHPGAMIDSKDAQPHIVGAVATKPTITANGEVKANVRIYDQTAINKIKSGESQLSPGFNFVVGRVGTNSGEIDGMHVNHVAIVSKGRAGPPVRVLDHLPEQIEVMQMSGTTEDGAKAPEKTPVNATEFAEAFKKAFDSALEQKVESNTDFDKMKSEVLDSVMSEMKPAMDAMIGFNKAQEKAKSDLEAAEAEKERKSAIDSAVKEAVEQERSRQALIGQAMSANDSLANEDLTALDDRTILVKAIGDGYGIDDNTSIDEMKGMLKAIVAVKQAAKDAAGSINPPPPTGPVPTAKGEAVDTSMFKSNVDNEKYNRRYAGDMEQQKVFIGGVK